MLLGVWKLENAEKPSFWEGVRGSTGSKPLSVLKFWKLERAERPHFFGFWIFKEESQCSGVLEASKCREASFLFIYRLPSKDLQKIKRWSRLGLLTILHKKHPKGFKPLMVAGLWEL